MVPALPFERGPQVPAVAAREGRDDTAGLDRVVGGRRQVPSVLRRHQLGETREARNGAAFQAASCKFLIFKRPTSTLCTVRDLFAFAFSAIHSTPNISTANSHENEPVSRPSTRTF